MTKVSMDDVFDFSKGGEGFRAQVYRDPGTREGHDVKTVGFGTTVYISDNPGQAVAARRWFVKAGIGGKFDAVSNGSASLTREEGQRLVEIYYEEVHGQLQKRWKNFDNFPKSVQIALYDMSYQFGGAFYNRLSSDFAKAIDNGEFKKAGEIFMSPKNTAYNKYSYSTRSAMRARMLAMATDDVEVENNGKVRFGLGNGASTYSTYETTSSESISTKEVIQEKDDGHALELYDGYPSKGKAATGNRVMDLQTQLLNAKDKDGNSYQCGNYPLPNGKGIDGKLGLKTEEMLKKFQKDHDLPVTGKVDAATQAVLDRESPLETKSNVDLAQNNIKTIKANLTSRDADEPWQTGDFTKEDARERVANQMLKALQSGDFKTFSTLLDDLPNLDFTKQNTIKLVYGTPLLGAKVTSDFGGRTAPKEGASTNHKGCDLDNGKDGSPILAVADGIVIKKGTDKNGGGNFIHILHADGNTSVYAHLSDKNFNLVTKGDTVTGGQKIAELGNTGNSTGSHLHFELRRDGQSINPASIINFAGNPYKGTQLSAKQIEAVLVLAEILEELKGQKRREMVELVEKSNKMDPTTLVAKDTSEITSPTYVPNLARKNSRGNLSAS